MRAGHLLARGAVALGAALCLVLAACSDDDSGGNNNNENQNQAGVCGDGHLDTGEECDDGAQNSDTQADACRTDCREAWCGDGVVDTGEECDDGDDGHNRSDACPNTCLSPVCGDGHVWAGHEECDDGNTADGDDCRGDCLQDMTRCGDGLPDPGEECDDGAQNSDTVPNACRETCQLPWCGDGVTDDDSPHNEACDDGAENSDTVPNVCRESCQLPSCGDGVVDDDLPYAEECDDGTGNSDTAPNACRLDCEEPVCGDGVIDDEPPYNEACDDGGQNSDDVPNVCRLGCELPRCGDGVRDDDSPYDEECDNGDENSDTAPDACRTDCTLPRCGDAVVDSGESCDGTALNGMTCDTMGYPGGGVPTCVGCLGFDPATCCQDGDGDGRGTNCDLGPDECDDDGHNWTTNGCDNCADTDGDGRGTDCDLGPDECEGDIHNWTTNGCANCAGTDGDGDGYGPDCDIGGDCDDAAPGIVGACQANGCPQGWVYIPAGAFEMGCNSGELDGTCVSDEQPRHTVTLSAYCIEETEVSVGAYRACVDASVCTGGQGPVETGTTDWCNYSASAGPREQHPINCLDWTDSRQYCQSWVGGDLPTEAEWEKAARGGPGDTRKYPWGASPEPDCTRSNFDYSGSGSPFGCNDATSGPASWEVGHITGTAGDSPHGLKDMAGNINEWVLDHYDPDYYS